MLIHFIATSSTPDDFFYEFFEDFNLDFFFTKQFQGFLVFLLEFFQPF